MHELGHLTGARDGAEAIIRAAKEAVIGDADAALSLSIYARSSLQEFWGEATAAANTDAWRRCYQANVRRLVDEVRCGS